MKMTKNIRICAVIAAFGSLGLMSAFSSLPAPWQTADIGPVGLTGSANGSTNGVFTVAGSGNGITYVTSDAFRYVYQTMGTTGTITAKILSQSLLTNAPVFELEGVMIRETTNGNSKFVAAAHNSWIGSTNSFHAVYRTNSGSLSTYVPATAGALPVWVSATRNGNTFSLRTSANGTIWRQVSTQTINMSSNVTAGLMVTTGVTNFLDTVVFTNVTFTP